MNLKKLFILAFVSVFSGCAVYAGLNFDELFGEQQVRDRQAPILSAQSQHFINEVKPIIDNRCVVCHACYDAPCQLKMSSVEGIDRGASKALVYQGTRLTASAPTRLFEDALTTQEWREADFHPVLNERMQNSTANLDAGLVSRMLIQKENHPLPDQKQLDGFDFSIDRDQQCPTIEEYAQYERDYPTWGMPYGMPNLDKAEYATLMSWLENGALMNEHIPLSEAEQELVNVYEKFLNKSSRKSQLSARYIYEHLFLSHVYFSDLGQPTRFFSIVRSTTPPGEAVQRITTRRPYDDPKVSRVYYRLIPEQGTIVDKTHMPFALNEERLQKWNTWFVDADYVVNKLPSYDVDVAANPMTSFEALPVNSRFNFMLDNAQNTIMAYIKGPVCRGQLALNVINDRFWVFFIDPEKADLPEINDFYASQKKNLKLPSELESNTVPATNWVRYSKQQARYLNAKSDFTNKWFESGVNLDTGIIWDGNGTNPNAALTIFRHFDSASVVQGLVGPQPKTAWILDYALLERIHYLLVAGFDVYGNFGHQLITRMFMDFLRLEGESNFLTLLPKDVRHLEHSSWYQNQSVQLSDFLQRNIAPFDQPTSVVYKTADPKRELLDMIKQKLEPVLNNRFDIVETGFSKKNEALLNQVSLIKGEGLRHVPQLVMIMIEGENGEEQLFTMIHNNAHSNISSLFNEEGNRDYANDDLTLVRGVVGSYPAAYLSLTESDIPTLVKTLQNLNTEEDYVALLDKFAVRRSSPEFWPFSDRVHRWYQQAQPIEFGLLDYNRFENR
ncbi:MULTISPECIES: fatty acid cis/trans isomerase [unclassified Vibrio]|uniref:fatty acid cis/trans isomerase n=1 Tax=unclassified Vibrio TaxID=2614977 RepID=UPI00159E3904|nr:MULTISPECIES: fatty acid cis/trans isomerase [unclassified Vibrio]NVN81135.1 fatty acid cis/trans isomerase [Vibrio sp. Scap16]QLE95081.1 fatty acid cis/trans isomerase [Vibrio sp. Scap24]